MAELPKLSQRILRLHSLRWNELIERHGFNGEHLQWHDSPKLRREAARPRFSLAPPPLTPSRNASASQTTFYGKDGQRIPYEKWHGQQMDAWIRRESDSDSIDSIGVHATVTLAQARFSEIIGDYLQFWVSDTDHNSEEFGNWSIAVADLVIREVGDLWRKDQWHASWFDRACQKKIHEALVPLIREWKSRASKLEIRGLENPQLSIESLHVSEGNLGLTSTLEKSSRAIERARELLRNLKAREPSTRPQLEGKPGPHERAGLCEGDLVSEPSRVELRSRVSAARPDGDTTQELEAIQQAKSQQPNKTRQRSEPDKAAEKPVKVVEGESVHERSERRSGILLPILASKRWKPNKWATRAGVSKNSVYEYLSGRRNLSIGNREALAEELGLRPEELPE